MFTERWRMFGRIALRSTSAPQITRGTHVHVHVNIHNIQTRLNRWRYTRIYMCVCSDVSDGSERWATVIRATRASCSITTRRRRAVPTPPPSTPSPINASMPLNCVWSNASARFVCYAVCCVLWFDLLFFCRFLFV